MNASRPHQAVSDRIVRGLDTGGSTGGRSTCSTDWGCSGSGRAPAGQRARPRHRSCHSAGPGARRRPRRCAGTELLASTLAVGRRPRSPSSGGAARRSRRKAPTSRGARRGSRRRRRSPAGNRGCIADLPGRRDRDLRPAGASIKRVEDSFLARASVWTPVLGRGVALDRGLAAPARERMPIAGVPAETSQSTGKGSDEGIRSTPDSRALRPALFGGLGGGCDRRPRRQAGPRPDTAPRPPTMHKPISCGRRRRSHDPQLAKGELTIGEPMGTTGSHFACRPAIRRSCRSTSVTTARPTSDSRARRSRRSPSAAGTATTWCASTRATASSPTPSRRRSTAEKMATTTWSEEPEPSTLRGGDGNDILAGGSGAETLGGGDGNDTIDGTAATSSVPGHRRRHVRLGSRRRQRHRRRPRRHRHDALQRCQRPRAGRSVGERKPPGSSAPGNITMDTAGVETVDFNALGGADLVTVNDLAGTDVSKVNVDLAATLGGATGDGQPTVSSSTAPTATTRSAPTGTRRRKVRGLPRLESSTRRSRTTARDRHPRGNGHRGLRRPGGRRDPALRERPAVLDVLTRQAAGPPIWGPRNFGPERSDTLLTDPAAPDRSTSDRALRE